MSCSYPTAVDQNNQKCYSDGFSARGINKQTRKEKLTLKSIGEKYWVLGKLGKCSYILSI